MVWITCHGKKKQRQLHHTESGRPYTMERRKGGHGTKRKYL